MNATMSLEKITHVPVMLNQILSIITPQHGGTFIDCTFGGGGYSKAILKYPNTKVIAIDRDSNVKKFAESLYLKYPNRFKFINDKFSNLENIIKSEANPKAIIFDLGFSSLQIADEKRGFSFNSRGPLNMQMGNDSLQARDVVNNFSSEDLIKIIKFLGEEKEAKKIVREIIRYRNKNTINLAKDFADIVAKAKYRFKNTKINPATKTFQALRIFVNKEITELINGLISATRIVKKNGIVIVVNFHSIEDKIVKNFFHFYSNKNFGISRYLPQKEPNENFSIFNLNQKKPILPNAKEITKNVRARSAKLRYVVRNENNIKNFHFFIKKFSKYTEIEKLKL